MTFFSAFISALCIATAIHAAEPPGDDGRSARAEFVSSLLRPGDIGAEIGVCMGVFAHYVLVPNQPSKLYLIDPWQYGLQADYEFEPTQKKQDCKDEQYEYVKDLFADSRNVEIVRMKSEDAVALFPDDLFDYVYIDGEHSYDAVWRDLNNYFHKVKVGGHLIGDDYGWTGIAPAVQQFLKVHQDEVFWLVDPYSKIAGGQFAIRRLK